MTVKGLHAAQTLRIGNKLHALQHLSRRLLCISAERNHAVRAAALFLVDLIADLEQALA